MGITLTRYDITELNDGNVEGFPVEDPPGWDAISLYYARALRAMGWQPAADGDADVESTWPYSDDPTSYYFQAAMHMNPRFKREPITPELAERWNHCTHEPGRTPGFFLAWHRAYIYWFEVIVRAKVAELGGPADWALPYWNYSFHDATDPRRPWPRSGLPWVFCQRELPDDHGPNPLFMSDLTKRGLQPTDAAGQPMLVNPTTPYYDDAYDEARFQPSDVGLGFDSTIDNGPHGLIHVDVGTGNNSALSTGWMRSTWTAAFDPIFWLHHSQIDRFWVGWNAAGHTNPGHNGWLDATDDRRRATRWNFWRDDQLGNVFQVYPRDVLDPENLPDRFPHSYRYADLPDPDPPRNRGAQLRAAARARRGAAPAHPAARAPQIGSTPGPLRIGAEPATARVDLLPAPQAVEGLQGFAPDAPRRIVLQLSGITAEGPADNFEIYLNHPEAGRDLMGEDPRFVGMLTTFGADHDHAAHAGHDEHAGHDHAPGGLVARYDVTDVVRFLEEEGTWDPASATVTFVAASPAEIGPLDTSTVHVAEISFHMV